jgi:2-iminobutanoate/2-iminopropanoate deaminase
MNWDVAHYPAYWFGNTTGELKRTELAYPHVPKEHPKFAESMVIGNLVFVSGCTGQDTINGTPTPETIDGQMANGLNGCKAAIEKAGSSMERIVKTFILARNASDYVRIREIELEFYARHAPQLAANPPPSTLIVVKSLARPKFLFEFEVIATIDDKMSDWQRVRHSGADAVGNFLSLAGCQPKSAADPFEAQARSVLDTLRQRTNAAGSSLDNVVKTHVFVKDAADIARYRAVEEAYFAERAPRLASEPPASTVIVVKDLPMSSASIEADAFAMVRANADWPVKAIRGGRNAAASVTAGKMLFLSGVDGSNASGVIETDSVEAQIVAALDKVKAAMEAAGSSLDKVLRTLMMLERIEDYGTMRATEVTYYEQHAPALVKKPPVSTFLCLPQITVPGSLFQIDVIGSL